MQVKIFVLPGGKVQIMVDGDDVDFDTAKAVTQQVIAGLQAQGLAISQEGEVEQHKDGVSHVHSLHNHTSH